MLVMLDLYCSEFEEQFMQATSEFYNSLSNQKLEIHQPADYILYVQELI